MLTPFKVFQLSVLLVVGVVLHGAVGYCSVSVMPMEVQHPILVPGSRIADEIELLNRSESTVHVTASVMDWTLTEQGDAKFSEAGTGQRSCAPWIQLNPVNFAIAPRQSVRVRYSITPPREITEEHWAMIFFKTRPMPVKGSRIGLNISTRIGCKVFLAPRQSTPTRGKIADMELVAPAQEAAKVKVLFENTGATNLRVQGKVEVRDDAGQLQVEAGLTPGNGQILSGMQREFWAPLGKTLPPGTYTVKAILDFGAKDLTAGELKATVTAPDSD